MNLTDINTIMPIMKKYGFNFSKGLGQNFLTDPFVCPEIARLCGVDENMGVLEIGPGVGVLTKELAKSAKKVVAIEIDKRLIPLLSETLDGYGNIKVIEGDVLKLPLLEIMQKEFDGMDVVAAANLPYYITSPIVMKLLEERLPLKSITVMVQKETAERFCAPVGSRESGAVTVSINYYAEATMLFEVPREAFVPSPNVDSAVIRLDIRENPPVDVKDEKNFFRLIKAAFSQRRKTVYNSISSAMGIDKEKLGAILDECGIKRESRAEKLTLQNFADIANRI